MKEACVVALRFAVLVVVLNVVRYLVAGVVGQQLTMPGIMGVMQSHPQYFSDFSGRWDLPTSYLYNFVMWAVAAWLFHLLRPVLRGGDMAASLKSFGLAWLFFAAVSAIYMNHYSHPKSFYAWNLIDSVLAFGVVAVANGALYRRVMGVRSRPPPDAARPRPVGAAY